MVLRVTEKTCFAKIPLNHSEHIDCIEFFYGLDWYGIIACDLRSFRPMLTKQLLYNYKELPKSFFFFFPFELTNSLSLQELKIKGFNIIDSYLFAYNSDFYHSQVNARGKVVLFETDIEKKYIQCDSGESKIHHPFEYAFDNRPKNYIHQSSDEEVFSGKHLINSFLDKVERKFSSLVSAVVAVFDDVYSNDSDVIKFIDSQPRNNLLTDIHFPGIIGFNENDIFSQIEFFKLILSSDDSKSREVKKKILNSFKSIRIYKLAEYDKKKFFTSKEIETIESDIERLPRYFDNLEVFSRNVITEIISKFIKLFHFQDKSISYRIHNYNKLYNTELMNYFFSGINGERPISQFLNFYHILERELNLKQHSELQGLKNGLNDKTLFSDRALKNIKDIASVCSSTQTEEIIKGKKNGWNRQKIAEILYKKYRNRIVHSKNIEDNDPIKPYTDEDSELNFWVCYVREMARQIIRKKSI